jgi:redox-sensitive bicupin YhaK (pirin superfamily)
MAFSVTPAPAGLTTGTDLRRAGDRMHTKWSWLDSRHSFSFGRHFDPSNTHFGLLLVSNDDVVDPGTGFETHPHEDMEIVTWVLQGQLVHQDSEGNADVIYPGLAQRMSAGTGILHSEKNDAWRMTGQAEHTDPVHFIQMWVVPDEPGAPATNNWRSTTNSCAAAWFRSPRACAATRAAARSGSGRRTRHCSPHA